jgi:hypothetical protein
MTTKNKHDNPILVTGAAGAVGGIGRNLTEFLLAMGHKVRALVRREDERAEAPRRLGAEVVEGDLTDLASMHREIGVSFDPMRGYFTTGSELRTPVVALSLGGLRRRIEALMLPDEVRVILQLDGLAERERHRRRAQLAR